MHRLTTFMGMFVLALGLSQAQSSDWSAWWQAELRGQGPDLVFVPGYGCRGEVWQQAAEALERRYRCHLLTLRQFQGEAPRDSALLTGSIEALHAYLEDQTQGAPIVVGHSIGGFFTLALASRYPQSLGALVSVDALPYLAGAYQENPPELDPAQSAAQYGAMDSAQLYQTTRYSVSSMVSDSARADAIARWSYQADRAAWGRLFAEFYNRDLRTELAQIEVPALMLVARGMGQEPTLNIWRDQYSALPQRQFAYHPEAMHFIMLDDPSWFLEKLTSFLSAHATQR